METYVLHIQPGVSAVLFNVGKIITYLVGTNKFFMKSAKYPDMAPVTLFRTFRQWNFTIAVSVDCRKYDAISETNFTKLFINEFGFK